jgi:hypothetical protein
MLVLPHGADRYDAKTYQTYEEYAIQRPAAIRVVHGDLRLPLQERSVGFKFTGGPLAQAILGFPCILEHCRWGVKP